MSLSRRQFLIQSAKTMCLTAMLGCHRLGRDSGGKTREFEIFQKAYQANPLLFSPLKPVVAIVKINTKWSEAKGIDYATRKAIDLIGGIGEVAGGKERILLKPNLVNTKSSDTTNPRVVHALARLMKDAGKEVLIGEAGAAAGINIKPFIRGYVCRTQNSEMLEALQEEIFRSTGYADLSKRTGVPLVNLHVGGMVKIRVPDNFVYKELFIHQAMAEADMICSVPMMKTHGLAQVTLGLKNIGLGGFPGLMYGTVRSLVHREGVRVDASGTAAVTIDMVRINTLGLTVIDATTAMEGQGPSLSGGGRLVDLNLIIASRNALAADMVAAGIMGFAPGEIDTFQWAWKAGMRPGALREIAVVGERLASVRREFARPLVVPYRQIAPWYGPPC